MTGKGQNSSIHDIFPQILKDNTSDFPHSILNGVFNEHWPPTPSTYKNDQADNIREIIKSQAGVLTLSSRELEDLLRYEMARVVFGSNYVERVGLGYKETVELCLRIFRGEDLNDVAMNMAHLEVTNHGNAFLHLLNHFIIQGQSLTENSIKETHAILCKGLSASDAGVLSSRPWGGKYRSISANERAFAGAHEFTKPSEIPRAMKSLVSNLQSDVEKMKTRTTSCANSEVDIWQLAAKHCERFVQIHPFRDGNGRMCRLILNVILIRFTGIPVTIGMNNQERDTYLLCAQESSAVGGNPVELGKIVSANAAETLSRWKNDLGKVRKYLQFKRQDASNTPVVIS